MGDVIFFFGREYFRYGFKNHPFSVERYKETLKEIEKRSLLNRENIIKVKPKMANEDILKLFHSQDYINLVKKVSESEDGYLDPDTPTFKGIFEVSSTVVGAAIEAVERILKGKENKSFNLVGGLHHAKENSSSGFCVFNDVTIAIIYMLEKMKVEKVFYIDIDAHHGDGVFYRFEDDERVWIVDAHQDGTTLFPGTGFEYEIGIGKAAGTKRNFSLPPYSGDKELLNVLKETIELVEKAKPEILLVQAGVDGIKGDPLTQLQYSIEAYSKFINEINKISERVCEGKIVVFGGGGYNINNCKVAWANVLDILSR